AEDGIRDGHVTGVQTCALPIFARLAAQDEQARVSARLYQAAASCSSWAASRANASSAWPTLPVPVAARAFCQAALRSSDAEAGRSEERRVGKECRRRWWREQGR